MPSFLTLLFCSAQQQPEQAGRDRVNLVAGTELQGKLEKLSGWKGGHDWSRTPRGLNLACSTHVASTGLTQKSEQLFRVLLLSRAFLASLAS